MTDKQAIINDIRNTYGNMLNISACCKALGMADHRTAIKFLAGVPYCDMGKERKYLAIDVARRIYERQVDT